MSDTVARGEDAVGGFTHGAVPAGAGEYESRGRENLGVRVGHGEGPADESETGEVVDVVAEVGDAVEIDVTFRGPGPLY